MTNSSTPYHKEVVMLWDPVQGKPSPQESTDGAALVSDSGLSPSAYGAIHTSIAASPSAGAQVEAFATGSRVLAAKNLSTTAGEYLILGVGESESEAETNRDAGMFILAAGESDSWRKPENATHYAWKSATGTPDGWIGQEA